MRILITGSRNWDRMEGIDGALTDALLGSSWDDVTVVHGGARGADRIAGEIARGYGWEVEVHPADWATHGKAAGPIRNQHMVNLGADVCLAFPLGESRGTRHCMAAAERAGIPVLNYGDKT